MHVITAAQIDYSSKPEGQTTLDPLETGPSFVKRLKRVTNLKAGLASNPRDLSEQSYKLDFCNAILSDAIGEGFMVPVEPTWTPDAKESARQTAPDPVLLGNIKDQVAQRRDLNWKLLAEQVKMPDRAALGKNALMNWKGNNLSSDPKHKFTYAKVDVAMRQWLWQPWRKAPYPGLESASEARRASMKVCWWASRATSCTGSARSRSGRFCKRTSTARSPRARSRSGRRTRASRSKSSRRRWRDSLSHHAIPRKRPPLQKRRLPSSSKLCALAPASAAARHIRIVFKNGAELLFQVQGPGGTYIATKGDLPSFVPLEGWTHDTPNKISLPSQNKTKGQVWRKCFSKKVLRPPPHPRVQPGEMSPPTRLLKS